MVYCSIAAMMALAFSTSFVWVILSPPARRKTTWRFLMV